VFFASPPVKLIAQSLPQQVLRFELIPGTGSGNCGRLYSLAHLAKFSFADLAAAAIAHFTRTIQFILEEIDDNLVGVLLFVPGRIATFCIQRDWIDNRRILQPELLAESGIEFGLRAIEHAAHSANIIARFHQKI
jgi:hypothetical protein